MRNNHISFAQLLAACVFITVLVCAGIARKMGPISSGIMKTNIQYALASQ